MAEDQPAWARRMYNERQARGWSQADAVRAMRAHSANELPSASSLLRQYKRWEAGEVTPKEFYQPNHRRDVRHGHARDVPGGAQARRRF